MEDRYQIEKTDDDTWTVRDTGLTGDLHYPIATYPEIESAEAVAAVLNDYADEEV
jgi:hypothetical protein